MAPYTIILSPTIAEETTFMDVVTREPIDENNSDGNENDASVDDGQHLSSLTAFGISFILLLFFIVVIAFLLVGIKRFRQRILHRRMLQARQPGYSDQLSPFTRERFLPTRNATTVPALPHSRDRSAGFNSEETLVTPPPAHRRAERWAHPLRTR